MSENIDESTPEPTNLSIGRPPSLGKDDYASILVILQCIVYRSFGFPESFPLKKRRLVLFPYK